MIRTLFLLAVGALTLAVVIEQNLSAQTSGPQITSLLKTDVAGVGDGGEQNAPLGLAVIGGLLLATVSTPLFVPVVYSRLRRTPPRQLDPELDTGGAS